MNSTNIDFEIRRKAFHLGSLIIPFIYFYVTRLHMSVFLLLLTSVTLYIDISKHYNSKIKGLIEKFLGKFLRHNEKNTKTLLTGSSYMALGFLFSCIFFEKGLAITSWLILIISDSLAAIIGVKYGTRLANSKSYEGSIVFLISACFISILTYFTIPYNTTFRIIIFSSIITTLVEFYAKKIKIDDNLSIPIAYCLSTALIGLIL